MIVGAILVMGYERLLSHWALKRIQRYAEAGSYDGALGFWAIFFDPILELLDRLGTSVLGGAFVLYLLSLRKRITPRLSGAPSPSQVGPELPKPTRPSLR